MAIRSTTYLQLYSIQKIHSNITTTKRKKAVETEIHCFCEPDWIMLMHYCMGC